jgi:apolipoprotein N-acyltransferase
VVKLKWFLLPVLSGLLQFAAFPRLNQGYLAWFAFIPLLIFVLETTKVRYALLGGLLSGLVRNFTLLIWIPPVLVQFGGIAGPLAWFLFVLLALMLSFFSGVACAATGACLNRRGRTGLLIFPVIWIALEYLSNFLFFGGFPWLLAGYSQTDSLQLIQISDIGGVYAVSFLVIWGNLALLWAWRWRRDGLFPRTWPLLAGATLLAIAWVYGENSLRRWQSIAPDKGAALLQGNLGLEEPESALIRKFRDGYVEMAARLHDEQIDLLVLPESPSPLTFQYDAEYREAMRRLASRFSLGMVFNNIARSEEGGTLRYFNSAYFLGGDGAELARYDKIHLVPFGEYIPLRGALSLVESITKDVSDFHPGLEYVTASVDGHPVSAIVCFESVFPGLVREFIRRGSQLIINLTNDGWYGDSAAPYQHLLMSRWRAIENRRFLLRATNSGISAIVDPSGRIQVSTPLLKQDICIGKFAFVDHTTPYTRYGDWFALACAIISFLLLLHCYGGGKSEHSRKS